MESNLFKTKSIEQLVSDVEHGDRALRRSLSAWDLTLLGIGGIIGTGSSCSPERPPPIKRARRSRCRTWRRDWRARLPRSATEFASMIPIAGSAYTYAYATLGELDRWT
jgi:basic amino acid/polyamine antiporter, APA family